jgi:hypothetical protein
MIDLVPANVYELQPLLQPGGVPVLYYPTIPNAANLKVSRHRTDRGL